MIYLKRNIGHVLRRTCHLWLFGYVSCDLRSAICDQSRDQNFFNFSLIFFWRLESEPATCRAISRAKSKRTTTTCDLRPIAKRTTTRADRAIGKRIGPLLTRMRSTLYVEKDMHKNNIFRVGLFNPNFDLVSVWLFNIFVYKY